MSSQNHANLQGEVVCIAVMDALFHSFDANDGQNRPKGLLPSYSHVRSDVINKYRPNQVSFPPPFLHAKVEKTVSTMKSD